MNQTGDTIGRTAWAGARRRTGSSVFSAVSRYGRRGLLYAVVIFMVAVALFPTLWVLSTSLKYQVEYFTIPPRWIPNQITFDHYRLMLVEYAAGDTVKNSIIIATLNTVTVLAFAVPFSYSAARYRVGGNTLPLLIIGLRMLPAVAVVIPFFLTFRALGLINTYQGMVFAYALFFIPFAVWLLLGFFEDFPQEIQDAAMIDGCNELQSIIWVVLPMLAGGVFVVGLLVFVFTWNDLLIALVLTRAETRTLMVFFSGVLTSPTQENVGIASGAVVIGLLPAYAFALLGQRFLVRGLSMGGLKG